MMKGLAVVDNSHTNGNETDAGLALTNASMSSEATSTDPMNSYEGYEPPTGHVVDIDRISPDIDPQEFFEKYVAQRKPVVIKGHLSDPDWRGHRWTNDYLKENAGNVEVIVEHRGSKKEDTFGLAAPKVNMKYEEFVDGVKTGNDRLYMTTQDLERFEDDLDDYDMPKAVLAEPLRSLQDDFPIQPQVLGNLIPYQLSLWHGIAKSGTSSGLHHDYHDNLYVLLRGRKRFRLFAPSAGPHMKTAGIIAKIHSNGLVVYRNKPDDPTVVVRSDGVPVSFIVRRTRGEAETELAEVEEALEDLNKSTVDETQKQTEKQRLEKKIEECESKIEQSMEDMLVYGCSGELGSGCEEDSDDPEEYDEPQVKKARLNDDSAQKESVSQNLPSYAQRMPDHFCDITFPVDSDDPNGVFTSHPHLKQVGCMVCDLKAGEMLYLPASWFHEVTSYSTHRTVNSNDDDPKPVKCSDDVGHLAFNYWMYPPDNRVYSQPYRDHFWPSRWETILQSPSIPIQHVWSSDDEEEEGFGEEEDEDEGYHPPISHVTS